jgi:hypothetical protein
MQGEGLTLAVHFRRSARQALARERILDLLRAILRVSAARPPRGGAFSTGA